MLTDADKMLLIIISDTSSDKWTIMCVNIVEIELQTMFWSY